MIARFTPALFWDTDIKTLSETTHAAYIIVRVCMLGTWEDWLLLKKMYGLEKIKSELLNARFLDPKTLNFFSLILNIPKEKFRCFSFQPSVPRHWDY